MSDFDPGPGWREMEAEARYDGPRRDQLMWTGAAVGDVRYFVREEPVPPLPTEPYTVIRATLRDGDEVDLLRAASGHWGTAYGHAKVWATDADIARVNLIRNFEVLAEPRAVTAKAVLDAVEMATDGDNPIALEEVGSEFGVD